VNYEIKYLKLKIYIVVSNENFGNTSPARGGPKTCKKSIDTKAGNHSGRWPRSTAARWHATTITSTSTKVEIAWLSEVKLTRLGPLGAGGMYKVGGRGAPI